MLRELGLIINKVTLLYSLSFPGKFITFLFAEQNPKESVQGSEKMS